MSDKKYRLVTRADFDGIVSGTLLNELDMVDGVLFVEPKDMQDGKVAVTGDDITTNLPFVEGVHLCFDHHLSETERVGVKENRIIDPDAPSAARVVYRYFGGRVGLPDISQELMDAVDQADSAQYTREDIMAPEGWTLLNFILDPRTGLEHLKQFHLPHDELMKDMMTYCRHNPIEEILGLPDVVERVEVYKLHAESAELQLRDCSKVDGKILFTDLRSQDTVYLVNRFLGYALYPDCNISITLNVGPEKNLTTIAVGKSILDRSSNTSIGPLMLKYGGGGHAAAGTCRVENDDVDRVLGEIIKAIKSDG